MDEREEGRARWELDPDAAAEYGEGDSGSEDASAEEASAEDASIEEASVEEASVEGASTEAPPDSEGAAESEALIEQFLTEAGGTVAREPGADEAWPEEPLPEGHKSGFVALIGRPNVGKSTLVNALVGHKIAIVSSKPQTTRSRVRGIRTERDHQLIFVDTPGIHQNPPYQLNKIMVQEAEAAIPDSDVLLFVVDVSVAPRREDRFIAALLSEKAGTRPVVFALNKMDLLPLERAEARIEAYWSLLPAYVDSMPISALRGTNIDRLLDRILDHVPEGPRYYPGDQVTDQTEHQIASELIREAVFKQTRQEIPHASAVLIEDYHERENGVFYVAARIWVERDSQKAIVIGRHGQRLKQIGIAARAELERLIGGHVYLDLWVKVQPRWRDHLTRLRELGY